MRSDATGRSAAGVLPRHRLTARVSRPSFRVLAFRSTRPRKIRGLTLLEAVLHAANCAGNGVRASGLVFAKNRNPPCGNLLRKAPKIPWHTALVGVGSAGCEIPSCV